MITEIIRKAKEMEIDYAHEISQVHPTYQKKCCPNHRREYWTV
jgi:hypothetical protein